MHALSFNFLPSVLLVRCTINIFMKGGGGGGGGLVFGMGRFQEKALKGWKV